MFDAFSAPDADTSALTSLPGRPTWSGLLLLRLVGIPLKAFSAVRPSEARHFHQYHADCGQRIRYAKLCPVHGPIDTATIVKGYEYGPQQVVQVEPEELDRLRPAQDRALRLERFLSPAQMDPLLFSGRSLTLAPDGPAARLGYVVLCQALTQRQRWAVGHMVLGGHRSLVLVRPAGTQLIAHLLHPPERLQTRASAPLSLGNEASEELRLAEQLIDAASGRIDWRAYRDDSAAELRALIEAKLQGLPAAAGPGPVVLPLRQALRQSVAEVPEKRRTTNSGKRSAAPTSSGLPQSRRD